MSATRGCFLLAALILALAAGGCQRSDRRTIGVVPKATSHLFWLSVKAGVEAAGREFDVDIEWNGPPTETDYTRQIQIVDSMVARRLDGIAIAASERKALVQAVERATAQGIPVTVFDSGLDSENYMSFVATDNYAAGRLGAETLAHLIGGKGSVAVLMHAPGSVSTMDRERGFEDVIGENYPGIRIVATQYGMSDPAKARAAAENILTANPGLDGIFASTEPSTEGVSLVLKSRGLSGKVRFVGFDSSDAMIADLRGGTLDAFIVQDPFRMGYEAVKTLVDKLEGGAPPKRLDLEARVITRENLDLPEIQQLLKPDLTGGR